MEKAFLYIIKNSFHNLQEGQHKNIFYGRIPLIKKIRRITRRLSGLRVWNPEFIHYHFIWKHLEWAWMNLMHSYEKRKRLPFLIFFTFNRHWLELGNELKFCCFFPNTGKLFPNRSHWKWLLFFLLFFVSPHSGYHCEFILLFLIFTVPNSCLFLRVF